MDAKQRWQRAVARAAIEIVFILFLFFANLLMGEYVRGAAQPASFLAALRDVVTVKSFGIGLLCAVVGYVVFERLRKVP